MRHDPFVVLFIVSLHPSLISYAISFPHLICCLFPLSCTFSRSLISSVTLSPCIGSSHLIPCVMLPLTSAHTLSCWHISSSCRIKSHPRLIPSSPHLLALVPRHPIVSPSNSFFFSHVISRLMNAHFLPHRRSRACAQHISEVCCLACYLVCHPSSCPIVLSSCPVVSHRFVVCPSSHHCPIVVVALPHSHSRSLAQHISQVSLFFIPHLQVISSPSLILVPYLVLSHPIPCVLILSPHTLVSPSCLVVSLVPLCYIMFYILCVLSIL